MWVSGEDKCEESEDGDKEGGWKEESWTLWKS